MGAVGRRREEGVEKGEGAYARAEGWSALAGRYKAVDLDGEWLGNGRGGRGAGGYLLLSSNLVVMLRVIMPIAKHL